MHRLIHYDQVNAMLLNVLPKEQRKVKKLKNDYRRAEAEGQT